MKSFAQYLLERDTHKAGTYVQASLDKISGDKLNTWVNTQKIPNPIDPKDYHVTILYSIRGIPAAKNHIIPLPIYAKVKGFKVFDCQMPGTGKCLVLTLDSKELVDQHKNYIKSYGAEHTFKTYIPHITLSYSFSGEIPKDIPEFGLRFDKTKFEPLSIDWQSNLRSKSKNIVDEY